MYIDYAMRKAHVLRKEISHTYTKLIRRITAGYRALPDFIIIGAQKAGTTSLYSYLAQHPQVFPAAKKEVHYFDYFYQNGELWYRSYFPLIGTVKEKKGLTGESSPFYLFHPLCAQRIHEHVPDVKLIVLLRNPVERAISHYFMEVCQGHETLPIGKAMRDEEARLANEMTKLEIDPYCRSYQLTNYSYKGRGIYADQLERYFEHFPREQIIILRAEDMYKDTDRVLKEVCGFLGIDQDFHPSDLRPRNVGTRNRSVPDEVYKYLIDFFRPRNKRLSELLGKDFNW